MALPVRNTPSFPRKQLSNHIAEHIRAEILAGNYQPGEFLRLDELANELGVSVTPVREAFLALSVEGFVQHAERRGFIVTPLKYSDFEDLYAMLAQVAGRLAERAALAITDAEITELENIQQQMSEAAERNDSEGVEYANDQFHRVINRTADSSKLAWILLSVLKYVPKRFYANIHGLSGMLLEQHERILTALRNRDSSEAYAAMHEHEKVSMHSVLQHLKDQGLFDERS